MTRGGGRRVEVDGSLEGTRVYSDGVELRRRRDGGLFIGIRPVKNVLRACWSIGLGFLLVVLAREPLTPAIPEESGDGCSQDKDDRDNCTSYSTLADTTLGGAGGRTRGYALCIRALVAAADGGRHGFETDKIATSWVEYSPADENALLAEGARTARVEIAADEAAV